MSKLISYYTATTAYRFTQRGSCTSQTLARLRSKSSSRKCNKKNRNKLGLAKTQLDLGFDQAILSLTRYALTTQALQPTKTSHEYSSYICL